VIYFRLHNCPQQSEGRRLSSTPTYPLTSALLKPEPRTKTQEKRKKRRIRRLEHDSQLVQVDATKVHQQPNRMRLTKLPHHPGSIPLRWRRNSARARGEDPPFRFLVGIDSSGTLVPDSWRRVKSPSRDLNRCWWLLDIDLRCLPLLQRELRGRRWGRLHLNVPLRLGGRE